MRRTIVVDGNPEPIRALRTMLASFLADRSVDEQIVRAVVLAFSEALDNAVEHGLAHSRGEIGVRIRFTPRFIVLSLRDTGSDRTPLGVARDPGPQGERGRGFQLMNKLMDVVKVRSFPDARHAGVHDETAGSPGLSLSLPRPLAAALVVAWGATVWWLLTTTKVSTRPWFFGSAFLFDLGHAVLFGVQSVLLGILLRPGPVGRPRWPWVLAAGLALAYAGLLEWRQGFIDGRESSWHDMLTNAVGAVGAPWALAAGSLLSRRALVVLLAALASAALAQAASA